MPNYESKEDNKEIAIFQIMQIPSGSMIKNLPAMQEIQKMQVQFLSQEDPLEEGMVTHSGVLAGKVPQTEESEEPGVLWFMGCKHSPYDKTALVSILFLEIWLVS